MMHSMDTGSEDAYFQIQVRSSAKPVAGEGMLVWFEEGSNVDLDEEQAQNKNAEKPYINFHQESRENIIEHGHRLNGEEIRHFRSDKMRVKYENLLSGTPGKNLPTAKDPLFIPATCCVMEFSTRGGTGAHFCLNACYTSEIPIIFNTSKNRRLLRWICNVLEYLVKLLLCVLEEETSQKRAFAIYCKFNVQSLCSFSDCAIRTVCHHAMLAFTTSDFPLCSRQLLNYLFSTTQVIVTTVKALDEAIEVYEDSAKRRKATKKLQILRDKEAWLKLFHDAVCCVCRMPCYRRRLEEAKRRHEAWLKARRKVEEEKAAAVMAEERTRAEAEAAVHGFGHGAPPVMLEEMSTDLMHGDVEEGNVRNSSLIDLDIAAARGLDSLDTDSLPEQRSPLPSPIRDPHTSRITTPTSRTSSSVSLDVGKYSFVDLGAFEDDDEEDANVQQADIFDESEKVRYGDKGDSDEDDNGSVEYDSAAIEDNGNTTHDAHEGVPMHSVDLLPTVSRAKSAPDDRSKYSFVDLGAFEDDDEEDANVQQADNFDGQEGVSVIDLDLSPAVQRSNNSASDDQRNNVQDNVPVRAIDLSPVPRDLSMDL